MRLLVTGGAGFIGSNFIRYILKKYPKYDIYNLDSLTYAGNLKNIADLHEYDNHSFIRGDIRDSELVSKIVISKEINTIINLAAETHVDRSINNPRTFADTNIIGTCNLLETAIKNNIPKFVQMSTDEVYGTLMSKDSFTEDSPMCPNSPYSASKAGADMLVRSFYKTFDLPINIIRSSNNYGPYQHLEKFIPRMITNTIRNLELPIYGDGLNTRDWLHVSDTCTAIDLVLHSGIAGEIYNVGGDTPRNNLEVARYILRNQSKPDSLIKYIADRLGHDRKYAIDCTKIKEQLGWVQKYISFEKGLELTIKWYIENCSWWEKL